MSTPVTQYDISAIYAMNAYTWEVLRTELGWTEADYGGRRPVIPASQEPEFMQYSRPFLVYGYAVEPPGDDWWMDVEQVAYTVHAQNAADVNRVVALLKDYYKRHAESAAEVNRFLRGQPQFNNLSMKLTSVMSAQGPGPIRSEGGGTDGLVIVRYGYIFEMGTDNKRI